jgi:hypothetical protein
MTMPPTFEKVTDSSVVVSVLNAYVIGTPGKGELCVGEVWRVKSPVTVYRLQNFSTDGKLGYWWALGPPQGTADDYRRDYVICPEWNAFTQIVVCQLKVGALVAVGPGQSATCTAPDGAKSCLAASAINQLNTDWKNNLEGCVSALYSFH